MKFKKGDLVKVTVGKDKDKEGKVERVFPQTSSVLVPGLNLYTRHVKSQGQNLPGGRIEVSRPIGVAKVVIVCPSCKKPTRVGWLLGEKEKIRICKKCNSKL